VSIKAVKRAAIIRQAFTGKVVIHIEDRVVSSQQVVNGLPIRI